MALAFSVGLFFGISPFLGLHTVLALLVAWLFRLNRFVAITGVYVTNPWTIVPIYAFCTWVGTLITGVKLKIPHIDWNHISIKTFFGELKPFLWSFLIGTTVIGVVVAFLSYIIVRKVLEKARKTA